MKHFNKILKQKLENYQAPPPESVLNNIRSKYPKRSFVEQLNYNKFYILATASILIITGLILLNNNKNTSKEYSQISKIATQKINSQTIKSNKIESKTTTKTENILTANNNEITTPKNNLPKNIQIEYVNIFAIKDTAICGNCLELNNITDIKNLITPSPINITQKTSDQNCLIITCNKPGKHIVYYQKQDFDKVFKDSIIILFHKQNEPTIKIDNRELCYGEELLVTLPNSDGNYLFVNTSASRINENQYKIEKLNTGKNSIQILYSDNNNCEYKITEDVFMNEKPEYSILISSDYCSKKLGSITLKPKNFTINYSTINEDINSNSGTFTNLSSGIYFIKTEYSNGCYVYDTLLISDSLNITPYFIIEKDLVDEQRYSIRNYTKIDNRGFEQNPDIIFTWKINGDTIITQDNPDFKFDKPGKYTIELIAQINAECYSSYSETIYVSGTRLRIPNIFTPNGDGIGDKFGIISDTEILNYQIQIMNKTGEIVFETKDINEFWDGKINGNNYACEGLYYYIIRGEDRFGNKIEQKGSLQLVRN